MDQETKDLIAAAEEARKVLRLISMKRKLIGPLATRAQAAAWQITTAMRKFEQ